MRLDGGRRHTSSCHAGFRLTEDGKKPWRPLKSDHFLQFATIFNVFLGITCEGDDENDGDVNEEELEVSQIAENLLLEKTQ